MNEIKKISKDEANNIIETRKPIGFFYCIENDPNSNSKEIYVGIDNSSSDAWVEEFKTLSSCKKWLNNEPATDRFGTRHN